MGSGTAPVWTTSSTRRVLRYSSTVIRTPCRASIRRSMVTTSRCRESCCLARPISRARADAPPLEAPKDLARTARWKGLSMGSWIPSTVVIYPAASVVSESSGGAIPCRYCSTVSTPLGARRAPRRAAGQQPSGEPGAGLNPPLHLEVIQENRAGRKLASMGCFSPVRISPASSSPVIRPSVAPEWVKATKQPGTWPSSPSTGSPSPGIGL